MMKPMMRMQKKIKCLFLLILLLLPGCSGNSERNTDTKLSAFVIAHFHRFKVDDRSEEYTSFLENSFGLSADQVESVLDYVEPIQRLSQVEADLLLRVQERLKELKQSATQGMALQQQRQFFIRNVMIPWLWLEKSSAIDVRGRQADSESSGLLYAGLGLKVDSLFQLYYPQPQGNHALRGLRNTYLEYHTGGYFRNDSINQLNEFLREDGFYLRYDADGPNICLFQITDVLIDSVSLADDSADFSVYLLQRELPCVLPGYFGLSVNGASDVIVFEEVIEEKADEIYAEVRDSNRVFYPDRSIAKLWQRNRIDMDLSRANRIITWLRHQSYADLDKEDIVRGLEFSVALHEAKHKYDEVRAAIRINWDNEISAHSAEVIFSRTPHDALIWAIHRIEGFLKADSDPQMAQSARDLWNIAERCHETSCRVSELREMAIVFYQSYLTYDSENLPDLADFSSDIVRPMERRLFESSAIPGDL